MCQWQRNSHVEKEGKQRESPLDGEGFLWETNTLL